MSLEKYYPPIPGKKGSRGRPSLEEMKERKAYWDTNGGPPQVLQQPDNNKISPTTLTIKKNAEVGSINSSIPDDIKKMIELSLTSLNDKDHEFINECLKKLPLPKRGRQSREDQAARLSVKEKINNFLATKMREEDGALPAIEENSNDTKTKEVTVVLKSKINIRQYRPGEQVHSVLYPKELLRSRKKPRRSIGMVQRHDIGDDFVFVCWNGGDRDWANVKTIAPFLASKEELDEIVAESPDSGDDNNDEKSNE